MSWIDDGIQRQNQAQDRRDKIYTEAEGLFETLWTEIVLRVTEAKKKGIPVVCQTSYTDRPTGHISLTVPPTPGQSSSGPKELELKLAKDKSAIEISGGTGRIIRLDLCDATICLKHNGLQIPVADAVKLILEPFFFSPDKS